MRCYSSPYSSVVEHPLSKRKVGSSILPGGKTCCQPVLRGGRWTRVCPMLLYWCCVLVWYCCPWPYCLMPNRSPAKSESLLARGSACRDCVYQAGKPSMRPVGDLLAPPRTT